MRPIRTAGFALAFVFAPVAYAVDDAAYARCRAIADPGARLACYDALAPGAPAAAPRAMPAPMPSPPAAAAPVQPQRDFGMEQRAPKVEYPTTMETSIAGRFEGWGPNSRIKLANGQVWQVVDGSSAIVNLDNPRVVIRRGMMGGFFLEFENSNRSPRVRRLQ